MADFFKAHIKTASNEGGYTDNPDDNGNWTGGKKGIGQLIGTNYGISAPVLKGYLKREPTVADMKSISQDAVHAIYKRGYWNTMRGDEILNQQEAESIYDACVNMGCGQAIKLAQHALGIEATGKMDDTTLNALNNKA